MFENEKVRNEDYMGMVSWSKLSGGARPMFGTEIETANPIRLTISHAEEIRDLSRYWFHPRKKIVEIEMTPIQWAEFLTSGGTSGIPCTVKQVNGEYMSEPKSSDIAKVYDKEVKKSFNEFDASLKKIDEIIKSAIDSNKPMGKKALEELHNIIDTARYKTVADVKFVMDSFKEDMEEMVTKAKAEFNAYVENRTYEIGIETIKNDSIKFLEDK